MTKREVKFRVWNGNSYNYIDIWVALMGGYDAPVKVLGGVKRMCFDQYTGMKDANGVEIYEDDIMQFDTGRIGVVGFDRGTYIIAHGLHATAVSYALRKHNAIVIGNVHEHPELLEGE